MKPNKRNRTILAVALCLGLAKTVNADPLSEGYAAFQRQDYSTAMRQWIPLAEIGDPQAQFYISEIYGNGLGVPADPQKALEWLLASARQGFPPAQFNVGNNYFGGRWVPQDHKLATSWWRGAAEQGFVQAQFNLAVSYFQGLGVERDVKQAVYWFEKAARGGSSQARETLQQLGVAIADEQPGQIVPSAPMASSPVSPSPAPQSSPPPTTPSYAAAPTRPQSVAEPQEGVATVSGSYRGGQNEAWLQGEPPNNYTLQVFSDPSHNTALHTAERMASLGFPVAVFSFVRDGRYWYATIVGSFGSAKEASTVRRNLPPEVLESKPWVRTMRSIHKIMVTE